MDIIQINKFSELHNNKTIIFCKTDFLQEEFKYIEKLNNDVVLITGNSDYPITDSQVNLAPKNIKKWFAQNALSYNDKIVPIPIGLENKLPSLRKNHGIGYYDRVKIKEELIDRNLSIKPNKKIYSNFKIETNFSHRIEVRNICISSPHIDWEEPQLNLDEFFDRILNYEMIVCPAGNGVDTHRLWEVLYSKRIPIVIKIGKYKIYELYEKLPIVILNSVEELKNFDLINQKYNECISKESHIELLNCDYWKNLIKYYEE